MNEKELKCMCCCKLITGGEYYIMEAIILGGFIYYNAAFCSIDCVKYFLDVKPIHEQSCSHCGHEIGTTAFVTENRVYCSEECLLSANKIKKVEILEMRIAHKDTYIESEENRNEN